ncbi:hypothetical protein L6252_00605, partial [Candidatus Parcubacteria bacterium]|nr:hypothetical protein [Candidatus Parcubacteria bacterium]
LKSQIKKDVVPGALVDYPKNRQCAYCQYKSICKLAGKEELRWLVFKEKIESQPQIETLPFASKEDKESALEGEEVEKSIF